VRELASGDRLPEGRVRKAGGGRKKHSNSSQNS
jgi:hypothetical protein